MAGFDAPESVDTSPVMAGFDAESVDTSGVVAGFGGQTAAVRPTAHRNAGRFQIAAGRLPTDAGGRLDPPKRPAQAPQRDDLLLFLVVQDVAHAGEGPWAPRRRQRLGRYVVSGRFSGVHQWPVLGVHRGQANATS